MLTLTIRDQEHFDDRTQRFVEGPAVATLQLEHSLFSLAAWESKWKKPFLNSEKTSDETVDYVKIMTLTPDVPPAIFARLNQDHYTEITEYIQAHHTATWFTDNGPAGQQKPPSKEVITAEIIYYWMLSLNIPFECQHWNLDRLLTLIRVTNEKNTPEKNRKKMSRSDLAAQRRALNAQRREKLGSRG